MSLRRAGAVVTARGFPRVSGDEPLVGKADLPELMFSPRERG